MEAHEASPPRETLPTEDAVELSILVPLYNERESIDPLYEQITDAVERLERSFELILVDDGSTDGTGECIDALAERDPRVVAIRFSRNFGQTAALAAGIDHATGSVIIPLDGDMQNDPADIECLLAKLDEGYDVVSGWRRRRHDSWTRVVPSRVANALISRVSGVRLHDYGCTLKAYRREILEGIDLYGEMHRFVPIYATWRGARVTEVPVSHRQRQHGASKYGFERIFKVLLDLIVVKFLTSYLTKPIYVFGGFGLLAMGVAFGLGLLAVVLKLIPPDTAWGPGWHRDFVETPLPTASIACGLVSIQMILIGLLAEMQTRTYFGSQGKKAFVVRSVKRHSRQRLKLAATRPLAPAA